METLAPVQMALARGRAYQLFGRLYLYGITAESLPLLQTIPELASHLEGNLDKMAADHYDLFGLNLFPYQTVFLDPVGLLGGEIADQVTTLYQSVGYTAEAANTFPDHLGLELNFLGFLCLAEADAWQTHQLTAARQKRQQQAHFSCNCISRWIQPWLVALRRQKSPFYEALGHLTADLLSHHMVELAQEYADTSAFSLPLLPPLLENEKTSLRQIVHYLLTPAYSGLFLSRQDVDQLARELKLPRGFGGREDQLYNLVQTAVQYDKFELWVVILQKMMVEWQTAYASIVESWSVWGEKTAVWQGRLTQTQNLLSKITKEAQKPL